MKVQELIKKLETMEQDREVIIRLSLDEEDEVGYVLEPKIIAQILGDEVGIYATYEATQEDCDLVGQIDLKQARKDSYKIQKLKDKLKQDKEYYITERVAFENTYIEYFIKKGCYPPNIHAEINILIQLEKKTDELLKFIDEEE